MVDDQGFRIGIGIILSNPVGDVLWAKRSDKMTWQLPQGGLEPNETLEEGLYRELQEELGLQKKDVKILGCTQGWLYYRWLEKIRLAHANPSCVGQKQKWFLLKLLSKDSTIRLDYTDHPELEEWGWVDYWYPLQHAVDFKKPVYLSAFNELAAYRELIKQS